MILSSLRMMERKQERLECREEDFEAVLKMVSVLVHHSSRIFRSLPLKEKPKLRGNLQEQFLDALPAEFSTREYQEIAQRLKIAEKTAVGYITSFVKKKLLERLEHSRYRNCQKEQETGPATAEGESS